MAVTQNVKYIVEVDASALGLLKTEVDKVRTCLDDMEAALRRTSAALSTANKSVGALTSKFNANAAAADKTTMAIMNQGAIFRPYLAGLDKLVQELANINTQNQAVISSTKQFTSALNSQTNALDKQKDAASGIERKSNDMSFLKLFGKFQAIKWIAKETFDQVVETAQNMDLDHVLGKQLVNYQKIFEETKQKTGGIVADNDIRKSMALMSSFGIDMAKYADSMELVQKMAVRTGQSAEYLTQSFARGVSRLSPLILDNLGIQVSLKDANEAYARSIGKSTDELTKAERTTALMNQVLEKLRANTEGVDLEASVATPWKKAGAFIENAWDEIKKTTVVNPVSQITMAFEDSTSAVKRASESSQQYFKMWEEGFAKFDTTGALKQVTADLEAQKSAWKALSENNDLADLFGGETDLFGFRNQADDIAKTMFGPQGEFTMKVVDYLKQNPIDWDTWFANSLNDQGIEGGAAWAAIRQASAQAQKLAEDTLKPYAGVLSKQEQMIIYEKIIASARESSVAALKQIVDEEGKEGPEVARRLALYKMQESTMALIVASAKALAEIDKKHITDHQAAVALDTARMANAEREYKVYEDMQKLQEGKTLTETALLAAQEQENEIATKLKKVWKEIQDARKEGVETVSLEEYNKLKQQLDIADKLTAAAKEKADTEILYFKKWKDASDVQLIAESTRLIMNANLLRVMNAQLAVAQSMPGVVKTINDITMAANEQMAISMENTAKRLMANYGEKKKPGGSGGRDSLGVRDVREKEAREYTNLYDEEMKRRLKLAAEASKLLELPDFKKFGTGWSNGMPTEIPTMLGMDPEEIKKATQQMEEFMALRAKLPEEYQAVLGDNTGFTPAYLEYMNEELAKMNAHLEFMANLAEKLNQLGTALDNIGGGMDGLFGQNYVGMVNDLASAMDTMANAMQKNNDAYGQALAGMGVVRAFTKNLLESRRQQAGVEAAMQAAAAWAAAATGNVPAAIAHGIAAAMYGGVALKVFRLPKGKETEDKPNQKTMEKSKRGDLHIHIEGPIALTEAERGAMIKDAIAQADRYGL